MILSIVIVIMFAAGDILRITHDVERRHCGPGQRSEIMADYTLIYVHNRLSLNDASKG